MEPRVTQKIEPVPPPFSSVEEYWEGAFEFVDKMYHQQLEHHRSISYPEHATPDNFWLEYIWCVYVAGFNSKVVARSWKLLIEAYSSWQECDGTRWGRVALINRNSNKFSAVSSTAALMRHFRRVHPAWWLKFRETFLDSVDKMRQLQGIGPVASHHLARNLGHNTVKPDLHLWRLAKHFEFPDPFCMCEFLSGLSGEKIAVVDLILFYTASTFGTISIRGEDDDDR